MQRKASAGQVSVATASCNFRAMDSAVLSQLAALKLLGCKLKDSVNLFNSSAIEFKIMWSEEDLAQNLSMVAVMETAGARGRETKTPECKTVFSLIIFSNSLLSTL